MSLTAVATDTSANWDSLVNDPAFYYKDSKEALQKLQQPQDNILTKLGAVILAFFTSPAGKFLGWIVFFVIIAWVLFQVFFTSGFSLFGKKAKKITGAPVEQSAESLITTNWEQHLNEAIQDADTRLAIRFSFMRLLQLLQINGLIHFEDNKTNADYYNELRKAELRQPFKQLSRQYEYAWYGHFAVPDSAYANYMNIFNDLKSRLKG